MTIFQLLSLIGGLAFFLFGMHTMSNALERLSGGMLERTLEKSTNSRMKAVLLGATVTALIQSSSATTVMVVGFVNGGIMTLSQSIGIIMGANIGTTITAWILSLTGIESSSIWIQLLKPSSFAPILAAVGAFLVLFSKKEHRRTIGSILCGFAVLMFGMDLMSASVKPLADLPEFANIMTMFTNPLLGVLVGMVITGIIQSSAASLGMLQALSLTGSITYGMAIPIIMGQNIGTCATALLSCIGASKNAKRTAMVHLYFNLVGTALFLTIFYIVNALVGFTFLNLPLNPADIALIHTIFNVAATVVLLPFADVLGKLATLSVPDHREKARQDEEEWPLDDRFLNMPTFALEQCKNVTCKMSSLARETILTAIGTVQHYDPKAVAEVVKNESIIDTYEDRLGAYLVKLSIHKLLPKDSREIGMFLHVIGDWERISDHAVNITEVSQEMYNKQIVFSEAAQHEIQVFFDALTEILSITTDAFQSGNVSAAKQVEPLEEVIDALQAELKSRHIARLQTGACTIELGFVLSDLLANLERVSDHCSNIAACMIQTQQEAFDMHSYLESVKATDGNPDFSAKVQAYTKQFQLP
ncbi:MAG: Na/Pi cotransporter family protein [Clostridia bacterium]